MEQDLFASEIQKFIIMHLLKDRLISFYNGDFLKNILSETKKYIRKNEISSIQPGLELCIYF